MIRPVRCLSTRRPGVVLRRARTVHEPLSVLLREVKPIVPELIEDQVDKALGALKRFRALCDVMHVEDLFVVATAASREAKRRTARPSSAKPSAFAA